MEKVRELAAVLFALAGVACGVAPESQGPGAEETGEVTEAYGEPGCAAKTTPDNVFLSAGQSSNSPATYGSASCVDSYIANIGMPLGGTHGAEVWYVGAQADGFVFPCHSMWIRAQLFSRLVVVPAQNYTLYADFPIVAGSPRAPGACQPPSIFMPVPQGAPGTQWRVVVQAGFILNLQPLRVTVL
jgi:hypothetical protein